MLGVRLFSVVDLFAEVLCVTGDNHMAVPHSGFLCRAHIRKLALTLTAHPLYQGLEAYGIFKIGEIIGRRNLVGYKLEE